MSFDWKKCIICQESTAEVLKCPLNGNDSEESNRKAYVTFLESVEAFRIASLLPVQLTM